MAAKKRSKPGPVKQVKAAAKKARRTGVAMSKKEQQELLDMVPTKGKAKATKTKAKPKKK